MTLSTYSLLLSAQSAIRGEIVPKLRAVVIDPGPTICLSFYYDGAFSEDEEELASVAATEIQADFWDDEEENAIPLNWQAKRIDFPQQIPIDGMLIYHRNEPGFYVDRESFECPRLISTQPDHVSARLVLCRALLGAVVPELRDVFVDPKVGSIDLYFYFDGPVSELALEQAEKVQAFVAAHTDDGQTPDVVKLHIQRLDYPARIPLIGHCVYHRYEATPRES